MTASGSVGKKISDWVLGSDNRAVLSADPHTGAVIPEVTTVTGNVSGSVGSVTTGVNLADDAITAAKFDETTAFPLKSADTGSTAVARTSEIDAELSANHGYGSWESGTRVSSTIF